jgi:Rho-binding antiterminator
MQAYQPISCIQHERLEFSILRRFALELSYRTETGNWRGRIQPLDVYTREGAEWLKFRDSDGVGREIRLDSIVSFQELPA